MGPTPFGHHGADTAATQLIDVGFDAVTSWDNTNGITCLIGWGTDPTGTQLPGIIVADVDATPNTAALMAALDEGRDIFGTRRHAAYSAEKNQWWIANPALTTLTPAPQPPAWTHHTTKTGVIRSRTLATHVLTDLIAHHHTPPADNPRAIAELAGELTHAARQGIPGIRGTLRLRDKTATRVIPTLVAQHTTPTTNTTNTTLNKLIARAAGNHAHTATTIIDPNAGTGATLVRLLKERKGGPIGHHAHATAIENTPELATQARDILTPLAGDYLTITVIDANNTGDSTTPLAGTADLIVTTLPTSPTTASTETHLNTALNLLAPNGRAVIAVPPTILTDHKHAELRQTLTTRWHTNAIITLNNDDTTHTVLVIDRGAPGQTFVAHLAQPTDADIDPNSPFINQLLAHIDKKGQHRG
ncbi:class I SAM-dependent methyltransferase [Corynebacterium aquilae]|uniref:DNA methylase adenine-specific domain-containing protein n=1 Tax=Corynebacterium aquilae DSM 44791 TaxID=1431546 RepID=A0A1L7CDT6_9CORY|nr:class I SAM-dependent methyltransferase [Corynebacterium aquilae]APT84030.1 hypothetical protein CAQU_01905 [Corynebacterium aquilae DSM 44791]